MTEDCVENTTSGGHAVRSCSKASEFMATYVKATNGGINYFEVS